jgi:hypothetical protein
VANESKKGQEEESGEFADFMADISEEIAQRVESLDSKPKAVEAKPKPPEPRPKVVAEERKKTPAPVDAGVIVEWPNIADRMIEEVR